MFWLMMDLSVEEHNKFTFLYQKYFNALLLFSKSIVKSNSMAEDVVQETFKRILPNLDKIDLDNPTRTKSYLVTIASNVAKDMYTKNLKRPLLDIADYEDALSSSDFDPTWELFNLKDMIKKMEIWISELSETEKLLMRYRIYEKWSYQQIESVFNIKESTASSIIARTRKKLIKRINQERREEK